jgi:hypothetical protein
VLALSTVFAGKTIARIPKVGGLFSPEQLPQSVAWPAKLPQSVAWPAMEFMTKQVTWCLLRFFCRALPV